MRKVRDETVKAFAIKHKFHPEDEKGNYVPLTFESLLDYLYKKQNRDEFWSSINKITRVKFDDNHNILPESRSYLSTRERERKSSNVVKDMHKFIDLLKKHEVESTDFLLH